jgi:hypothetical protein
MVTHWHSAGFGKRIEYWIIGRMLKEGMDVYVPLVDDHVVDAIVRRSDGTIALVQIKARSNTVAKSDAALFSAIPHEHRDDYWFVFFAERLDTTWFNGKCMNRLTGQPEEYIKERYLRYVVQDFSQLAAGSATTLLDPATVS